MVLKLQIKIENKLCSFGNPVLYLRVLPYFCFDVNKVVKRSTCYTDHAYALIRNSGLLSLGLGYAGLVFMNVKCVSKG